jgi:hypothetical protein
VEGACCGMDGADFEPWSKSCGKWKSIQKQRCLLYATSRYLLAMRASYTNTIRRPKNGASYTNTIRRPKNGFVCLWKYM